MSYEDRGQCGLEEVGVCRVQWIASNWNSLRHEWLGFLFYSVKLETFEKIYEEMVVKGLG